jgi:small GTP-binding protein
MGNCCRKHEAQKLTVNLEELKDEQEISQPDKKNIRGLNPQQGSPNYKASFHSQNSHPRSLQAPENDKLNPINKPDKSKINIVILGAAGVGKTSMIIRYNTTKFDPFSIVSISMEEYNKNANYAGNSFNLNQIVIPGEIQYQRDYTNYYREADFYILCYDVTKPSTYERVKEIISNDIGKFIRLVNSNPNVFILANKSDLKKQVDNLEVSQYCDENKFEFYETSVKNNINVIKVFTRIIQLYNSLLNKCEE